MVVQRWAPGIFTLEEAISEAECVAWIARGEAEGFDEAPVTTAGGFVHLPAVRNNTRAMFDDPEAVARLEARLGPWLPAERAGGWRRVGLNERLRVYRYRPGQYFKQHRDGAFVRTDDERSLYTLMVYLDTPEAGGSTRLFPRGQPEVEVQPRPGRVLVFDHDILHSGEPVGAGVKHVLRTDVMYRRAG